MSEHTPTPWVVVVGKDNSDNGEPLSPDIFGTITGGNEGWHIARVWLAGKYLNGEANAEFIVLACNNHDALVKALEGVIRVADRKTVEFDAARAALAKARGES